MKGFTRPKMTTLPASAQIPAGNLRRPPSRFTHTVSVDQPYFYEPDAAAEPPGTFTTGTRVALIAEEGADVLCRVVDDRGLSVYTSCSGLEPLPQPKSRPQSRARKR